MAGSSAANSTTGLGCAAVKWRRHGDCSKPITDSGSPKIRAYDKERRRKAKRALSSARRECTEAIERFDEFEAAMDTLRGALECVDLETGELHRPEHVQALIEQVAGRIESLGVGEYAKLAKYLRNRAPGLVLAQKSVLPRLEALAEPWSVQAVSLGCICWYLVRELHKRPAHARRRALSRHLLGAYRVTQFSPPALRHPSVVRLTRFSFVVKSSCTGPYA